MGMERGKRAGAHNADPFPRWPLWTAPLPTARPESRRAPSPPGSAMGRRQNATRGARVRQHVCDIAAGTNNLKRETVQ